MRSGKLAGSVTVVLLLFITAAFQTAGAGEPVSALGNSFPSARAYAMGGAYTAIASDFTALQANPAGLGQSGLELSLGAGVKNVDPESFSDETWDTLRNRDLDFSAQTGINLGGLGLGVFADGTLRPLPDEEDRAALSISGRASAGLGLRVLGPLRIGAAYNRLVATTGVVSGNPDAETVNYDSHTDWEGYSLNAGVLAKMGVLSVGLVARDLTGSISTTTDTGEKISYTIDPSFQAGVALQIPRFLILGSTTLAADYQFPSWVKGFGDVNDLVDNWQEGVVRLGAETNILFNLLSLRAGQVKYPGDRTLTTLGLGVNLLYFHADLAVGSESMFEDPELSNALLQITMRF